MLNLKKDLAVKRVLVCALINRLEHIRKIIDITIDYYL